jgi:hypothetical protein
LLNYLITNTYTKLSYLKVRQADPIAEIKAVLATNDIGQQALKLEGEEGNPLAMKEIRDYLQLKASAERILLSDVVDRFTSSPWGWKPDWEVVLLVTRLFMAGEIQLVCEGVDLDPKSAVEPLTKSVRFKQVSILKKKVPDTASISRARDLYKQLFSKIAREDADGLVADFRTALTEWLSGLESHRQTASAKYHPGKEVIDSAIASINQQLAIRDAFEFIEAMLTAKDKWLENSDDIADVLSFYKTQLPTWQKLLDALTGFGDNRDILLKESTSATALVDLEAIRENSAPYSQVPRIEPLIKNVEAVNEAAAQDKRELVLKSIDAKLAEVQKSLDQIQADAHLRNQALYPLQDLKTRVAGLISIPKILYAQEQAGALLDEVMLVIETASRPAPTPPGNPPPTGNSPTASTPKPARVIRAAELSPSIYLETEAEVEAFVAKLKAELIGTIHSGKRARIQ